VLANKNALQRDEIFEGAERKKFSTFKYIKSLLNDSGREADLKLLIAYG